jgi:transposase-like protein
MARPILSAPHFKDEAAAFAFVESALWPDGPFCPHCGGLNVHRVRGKSARMGLFNCNDKDCKKQFTVRVGTIFELSHLPLHLWLQVIHLMCASKKGISTRQIQRLLNCSMKTAWHLSHRIREIMKPQGISMLGGEGKFVEADITYVGRKPGTKLSRGVGHVNPVLALVEREGRVRAFHMPTVNSANLGAVIGGQVSPKSHFRTDEANVFTGLGWNFASHETVKHSADEYVRGDAHSNTVEGFFSVLKRGVYGTYQRVSEKHLPRYLNEFAFRHSNREALGVNDAERAGVALSGARGRRLTYQTTRGRKPVSRRPG